MNKVIFTSACDPREADWQRVLELTTPRMKKYAEKHGYDFRMVWYEDIDHERFPEFRHPDDFVKGSGQARLDFIRFRFDRSLLAPNWLRYAMTQQYLDEYDLVVYMDGDLLLGDMETDLAAGIPEDKWLATAICGPNPPHDAGPGGPLFVTRSCEASRLFWELIWCGRKWIDHPLWTDGVDFMDRLGYTIMPPVHKVRETEYDAAFYEIPNEWVVWGRNPGTGKAFHMGGGNMDPFNKAGDIARIIKEKGL